MTEWDEYEFMECCASGSCEVCGGVQGLVRATVRAVTCPLCGEPAHDYRCDAP